MKCCLLRVGVALVCFSAAAFATSVAYTEVASVTNGCTDPSTGNPIVLTDGNCTVGNSTTSPLQSAWGVGAFTTSGSQMNGLQVTVTFSDNFTENLTWATTTGTTGGVSDTTNGVHNWSLTETGDTFTGDWVLTNNTTTKKGGPTITGIVLTGIDPEAANCPAGSGATLFCGTVFDRLSPGGDNDPNEQTPNSHRGTDFTVASQSNNSANYALLATYSNEFASLSTKGCNTTGSTVVERSGANAAPCGDEWAKLTLTFNTTSGVGLARGDSISFLQDSDSTLSGPEPRSLFLSGLGLLAVIGYMRRKRFQQIFAARSTAV
jgi:hypothetical protein